MQNAYRLNFTAFSTPLSVYSFTLTEALNDSTELVIELDAQDGLNLTDYLGQSGIFTVHAVSADALNINTPSLLRSIHATVFSCERLGASNDSAHYRFHLATRFSALKQHYASRLFQNQNVPDIIITLLKKHGYVAQDWSFETERQYPTREYVTQYEESDWDFIARLCSEEGIWFYFKQQTDKDSWVFADSPKAYMRTSVAIAYRENAGLESAGKEALNSFRTVYRPVPANIHIDDYNYRYADINLSIEQSSFSPADGSLQLWGLHHKTTNEAQEQLRLHQEAAEVRRINAQGTGNALCIAPAVVFQSQPAFNENGWLVTSAQHSGSRSEAYQNTFNAIPAQLAYRPQRLAHPKVAGSLPARIVSPDHYTYAYLDHMGRYRVRLPFDLDSWSPGGDSRPVRLAKPYAGPQYGHHFPLHEGTEVMLSFVQGNPDRPYISGVMHDSSHPDHINNNWNTRNVIRTWANNKLRMEDKQGQEHIKLATEHNKSQLNLGHIVNKTRQKRGQNGEGFELRTNGWGSIRAGKGLMLSTFNQSEQLPMLDMDETIAQLEDALSLAKSLNQAAQGVGNIQTQQKDQKQQLDNNLKNLKQAALIQTAPSGIASATASSQLHSASKHIHHISGKDTNISAGQNFTAHAAKSVNLFAQDEGIRAQANQGKISIQAQNDQLQLAARKDLTITSSEEKITIAAKKEILLTAGKAYIRIKDGEIELGMPQICRIRCEALSITGPKQLEYPTELPPPGNDEMFVLLNETGQPIANFAYKIVANNGEVFEGITNEKGQTVRIYTASDINQLEFHSHTKTETETE